MSRNVDISEVKDFHDKLQENSEDVRTSLIKIQKSIETIENMDFSGDAADSAKNYFNELHKTILESFRGVFTDLEENLDRDLKTFSSNVDSSESAVIESSYLEDVQEDIEDLFEALVDNDETITETIQSVSEITSASVPTSFSEVGEAQKDAVKIVRKLDEDFSTFADKEDESKTKQVLSQIEEVMNSAKSSEGKARFTDFEGASEISDLAKLQDYNEEKREERYAKAEKLQEKMEDGKTLDYIEREMLYEYIQDELLDEGDEERIDDLVGYIQDDSGKLKEHINESVLKNEEALMEEISFLELYLFAGNESPEELHGDNSEEKAALRSYKDMLIDHHKGINEAKEKFSWNDYETDDPLFARVEDAEFEYEGTGASEKGHMKSRLTVDYYQNGYNDREEFLDAGLPYHDGKEMTEMEGELPAAFKNISEIKYYDGYNALSKRLDDEKNQLEDEVDTMGGEYIGSQLVGIGMSFVWKSVSIPTDMLSSWQEYNEEKDDKKNKMKWKDMKTVAGEFNLEIQTNQRSSHESDEEHVALHPTDETFEKIKRWEEVVYEYDNEFPYDEDLIRNQDWEGIRKLLYEESDLDSDQHKYHDYILSGDERDKPDEE